MILYDETFEIVPVAQERVRGRLCQPKGRKPFIVYYDPKKSKDFKVALQNAIKYNGCPCPLLDRPLVLSCRVYIPRPKSVTRKYPEVKPDLSNYIKGVEDAMNGLVYTDDSKIVGYNVCWKRYTNSRPRIEVTLYSV